MDEELIDKVARALAESDPQQCGQVDDNEMGEYFWEKWRDYYLPMARAAVATVKEFKNKEI